MGIRYSGTGVTDYCDLPCRCWQFDLNYQEEQPVLLISEPSQYSSFIHEKKRLILYGLIYPTKFSNYILYLYFIIINKSFLI